MTSNRSCYIDLDLFDISVRGANLVRNRNSSIFVHGHMLRYLDV